MVTSTTGHGGVCKTSITSHGRVCKTRNEAGSKEGKRARGCRGERARTPAKETQAPEGPGRGDEAGEGEGEGEGRPATAVRPRGLHGQRGVLHRNVVEETRGQDLPVARKGHERGGRAELGLFQEG